MSKVINLKIAEDTNSAELEKLEDLMLLIGAEMETYRTEAGSEVAIKFDEDELERKLIRNAGRKKIMPACDVEVTIGEVKCLIETNTV
jgi:hypothetical protein